MAKTHFLWLLIICTTLAHGDDTRPVFILGDSTADVGTNNYLAGSYATANFPQYGIDFPHRRPTGRFSNGFNSADALAKRFGLNRSPSPFLYLLTLSSHRFHKHLFRGVNFASGGSGLLDQTGSNLTVVPLSEQITQFSSVRDNFTATIGEAATEAMLNKSLFFISIGSNDIFTYFNTTTPTPIPKDQFISMLISTYSEYISTLYRLGARKLGIINVPPVGCCPYSRLIQMQLNGTNDCFHPMNDFALSFHIALDMLLRNISSNLPGIKYSLGNTYQMTLDAIADPKRFSLDVVDSACCGYGAFNAQGRCNSTTPVCSDRSTHLFWDKYHPTQEASDMAAEALFIGLYTSPISFSQLAQDN